MGECNPESRREGWGEALARESRNTGRIQPCSEKIRSLPRDVLEEWSHGTLGYGGARGAQDPELISEVSDSVSALSAIRCSEARTAVAPD